MVDEIPHYERAPAVLAAQAAITPAKKAASDASDAVEAWVLARAVSERLPFSLQLRTELLANPPPQLRALMDHATDCNHVVNARTVALEAALRTALSPEDLARSPEDPDATAGWARRHEHHTGHGKAAEARIHERRARKAG